MVLDASKVKHVLSPTEIERILKNMDNFVQLDLFLFLFLYVLLMG